MHAGSRQSAGNSLMQAWFRQDPGARQKPAVCAAAEMLNANGVPQAHLEKFVFEELLRRGALAGVFHQALTHYVPHCLHTYNLLSGV